VCSGRFAARRSFRAIGRMSSLAATASEPTRCQVVAVNPGLLVSVLKRRSKPTCIDARDRNRERGREIRLTKMVFFQCCICIALLSISIRTERAQRPDSSRGSRPSSPAGKSALDSWLSNRCTRASASAPHCGDGSAAQKPRTNRGLHCLCRPAPSSHTRHLAARRCRDPREKPHCKEAPAYRETEALPGFGATRRHCYYRPCFQQQPWRRRSP
jgi:hypothetical protein